MAAVYVSVCVFAAAKLASTAFLIWAILFASEFLGLLIALIVVGRRFCNWSHSKLGLLALIAGSILFSLIIGLVTSSPFAECFDSLTSVLLFILTLVLVLVLTGLAWKKRVH